MFERTSSRLMACHTQDDFGPEPARGDFSVEYERAGVLARLESTCFKKFAVQMTPELFPELPI